MSKLLLLGILLIGAGGALAWFIQTGGGSVQVRSVQVPASDGSFLHARLYLPSGVSAENPAPGIVAVHGYINSNETQSGFAIEFARRGYVVLSLDQPGHGYSDPPSGAGGWGGPAALAFLRTLDVVDLGNIGLEGHSMGGWAALSAAGAFPDGYRSIVLVGSGPVFGSGAEPPRNVSVVFTRYDEFAGLMWGVPAAHQAGEGQRMQDFFGTGQPVEEGRVYGSIAEGTARVLHQPPVTHPGAHLSRAAIGLSVDWFAETLDGGRPIASSNQVWYWKELGTLIALIGMVLLAFPIGAMLLARPTFAGLSSISAPARGATGPGWWLSAAVFLALPPLTLFPFKDFPGQWGISASALLPQAITTQVAAWAVMVGAISLVLFLAWHLLLNRKRGGRREHYGLRWVHTEVVAGTLPGGDAEPGWKLTAKAALLAVGVVSALYVTVVLSANLFGTDYRFWVFGVKPMSLLHLRIALGYLVPFTLFFLVLGVVLHGQLRREGWSFRREMVVNILLLTGGFAALLAYQYIALFSSGELALGEPLWTVIAFQFLPLMTMVGLISTWFFRRTGTVFAGAFTSAMLVTWIVVASQAIHHPF